MLSTQIRTDDPDQPRTEEQQKFLEMLCQICSLQTSFSLPRNPVSELTNLFAIWQEKRYTVSDEIPYPPYPRYGMSTKDGRLVMEQQERVLHEGITEWAVRHNLVSPEGLVPNWILNWAEDQFFGWSGEPRPLRGSIQSCEGKPGLAIGWVLPFELAFHPTPGQEGESVRSYQARQRREFKQWQKSIRQPKPSLSRPKKRKQGNYETLHYEFLVLKLCGVRRIDIFARYKRCGYTNPTAITNAVKLIAKRIGLRPPLRSEK